MAKEWVTVARAAAHSQPPKAPAPTTLIDHAIQALAQAMQKPLDEQSALVEERNVWQPNSWLIQRCWETLADAGAGEEALKVARLLEIRQPLAPLQALYRTAQQRAQNPAVIPLLRQELERWQHRLLQPTILPVESAVNVDQLLHVAATATLLEEEGLALACLERIDQAPKAWSRLVTHPEQREQLAATLAHISPNPLTTSLITGAIRRFDDAGTQFLQVVATQLHTLVESHQGTPAQARLLVQCIDTVRYATIVNLQSRRIVTTILAQAAQVDEVVSQISTIQNVLAAQRATGYNSARDDTNLLRQVKRTTADRDVDFMVHVLRSAIEAMPLRGLSREQRIALADQVAAWGARSDGWTAASAAATLINLGAIKYAIGVVDQIHPNDPARSEGMLTLVRGLLELNEPQLAAEQAERAITWARTQTGRNPERALIWGLAEIYLAHKEPQTALRLLERWREPTGWQHKMRTLWGEQLNDDTLRNSSLRFQALLQAHYQPTNGAVQQTTERAKEIRALFTRLQKWAPRLLEGEALINFYVNSLLQPLLTAQLYAQLWALLPQVREALVTTSGNKHAVRVAEVTQRFLQPWQLATTAESQENEAEQTDNPSAAVRVADLRTNIESFLIRLWESNVLRGAWQTVHSLEGSLALLLVMEGPAALVTIAQRAAPMQLPERPPPVA